MMVQIKRVLIVFALVVMSLPIIVFFSNHGTGDMDVWLEWTSHIDRWGPLNAYSIINTDIIDTNIHGTPINNINTNHSYWTTDYPPITFINLWLAMRAAAVFGVSWMIGIKIMLFVYYLATWVSLIYLSTLFKRKPIWISITVASGLFLGGLYFIVISQAFTTLDITFAPYVVFSLALFARRKYLLSGMCFALAVLVKWIAIMMLPAFLFYFIIKKGRRYKIDTPIFKFLGAFMSVFGLLIIGFWLNHLSLFSLAESLRKASSHGVWYFEIGGLNFVWLIQNGVLIPFYPETYGMIIKNNLHIFSLISGVIFLLVDIAILKSFLKRDKNIGSLLQASLMISWSYFIWRTGVHANHLFITILTALCLAIINTNKSNIRLYLWLSFFGLASPILTHGFPVRAGFVSLYENYWLLLLVAAFHVLIYLVYLRTYLQFQHRSSD